MSLFFQLGILICGAIAFQAKTTVGTSMKMDFLTLTDVRTDPIVNPTGLSSHVHRFFGANKVAPATTFTDLRRATGNSGNVEENLSLYWHPVIYRYDKATKLYSAQDTSLFSAYYIWETGATRAFPEGFRMIGGGEAYHKQARQEAECVDAGRCPSGDCETWNDFFPATTCEELEMSMDMPSCWDGVHLDSVDHRSHVAYPKNDEECPSSHPVRLPLIQLFTRIQPYFGGIHVFSDGTGFFHADYISGWVSKELQQVLDECENDSFSAMPTAWCEDHVTFRDGPKNPKSDSVDLGNLQSFQPPPLDTSDITEEVTKVVSALPGSGNVLPTNGPRTTSNPQPTTTCQNDYDLGLVPAPWDDFISCADEAPWCNDHPTTLQTHCRLACGLCSSPTNENTVSSSTRDPSASTHSPTATTSSENGPKSVCGSKQTKNACRKIRWPDVGVSLLGKFSRKRACSWTKGECKPIDPCGSLKGRKKCLRFGEDEGCVYDRVIRRCVDGSATR